MARSHSIKKRNKDITRKPKKEDYSIYDKDAKICSKNIDLDNLDYFIIKDSEDSKQYNFLKIKFNTGMSLLLKNHLIFFESNIDKDTNEKIVSAKWLKKWDSYCFPIYKTWLESIKKYRKEPLYHYVVKPIYKYFPIIIEKESSTTITVNNYCGVKLKFPISFNQDNNLVSLEYEGGLINYKTYNDIIGGSILDRFKALRYKIKLHNRDRRVFIDGFLITKKVLYKNEQNIYQA